MPPAPRFRVDRAEAVALLRIDNPPRNLLTLSMVADLAALVAELEKDDSVRSAVVTGEGPALFSAGLDMREWSRLSPKAAQDEVSRGQDAFWAFEHLTKPTIAAIAGVAVPRKPGARRESDQAGAHGGRREAVPEPVPPRVPACGSAPVVGRLQGRDAETPGQEVIHDLRRIESFGPHRFSSMSTPTSVAANDPSLRPASFKILRRCSSPSNARRA